MTAQSDTAEMAATRGLASAPDVGGLIGDWRFHKIGGVADGVEGRGIVAVEGGRLAFDVV